jgi:Ca2+-binding RTX toxin-like protein
LNGANGFRIDGEGAGNDGDSGCSVASAGDVNGDGFADLIIGDRLAYTHGYRSGASYVVFGKEGGFAAKLQLSNLNGSNGFKISGEASRDYSGWSVASAGDINGDGFADVIVGAPQAYAQGYRSGVSYIVFGKQGDFAANLELSSLNGSNGFQISGSADDRSGFSVASAGDVNGDGFADVIVGAPAVSYLGVRYSGATYIVFGKASGFDANLQLSSLNGANGFKVNGEKDFVNSGRSVASAGDVNGDGFADVTIGAWGWDPDAGYIGTSYVVFGHRALEAVNRVGTAIDNTINGGRGDDTIDGRNGDDRLIGWEGSDTVMGGNGEDRLNGRSGDDVLDGGAFGDVLIGGLGSDVFDYNVIADSSTPLARRDVIRDFTQLEDKIDLSDLGALAFIGTAAFSAAGQVRVEQVGASARVQINLAGPDAAEMAIVLRDVIATTLTAEDFIL